MANIRDYEILLRKVKIGNCKLESMDDFYNDVLDAYLEGKLEQKDFDRIMKEVSDKTTEGN